MSRDPLEELFGPLDSDDTDTGALETSSTPAAEAADTSATTRAFEPAPAVRPRGAGEAAPRPAVPADAPTAPFATTSATAARTAATATPAPATVPAPGPVRARATRDARQELPTRPVPAEQKRSNTALPWIIVAAVAVLALVGALLVVNAIRGNDEPTPAPTTEAPAPEPTEPEVTESETPPTTPEEPEVEEAPKVDVGPNPISMDISYAGISVESSQKLTNPLWFYQAGPPERVMFESGLMNTFPDSCSAMRSPTGQSPWGIEKGEGDTWTVVRPEGTCEADPKLYNEVWGLMQAVADSAKPL
ncbi:hypothetical protein U746_1476 [Mycolicibacterium mucogenicum 261Sha1.1M5]|uniref:hypothetical protein n=1 Tax=Leucobacter aridicollis TaxID=283878 RepID=UPI000F20F71E|nr:hypothetical protein [Leucobacter aridicollis]MCS3426785.1 hypothetical protein [Leucobacter aridicollis]RKQ89147.1 hypothetical protein U746_1476 [Mycolicibacterium mucogenicum 261Sha1.1M5]